MYATTCSSRVMCHIINGKARRRTIVVAGAVHFDVEAMIFYIIVHF